MNKQMMYRLSDVGLQLLAGIASHTPAHAITDEIISGVFSVAERFVKKESEVWIEKFGFDPEATVPGPEAEPTPQPQNQAAPAVISNAELTHDAMNNAGH